MHDLKWFIGRVGKKVFRDDNQCPCEDCKNVFENGKIIDNKNTAIYLYDIQNDYASDGIKLNYRDEK